MLLLSVLMVLGLGAAVLLRKADSTPLPGNTIAHGVYIGGVNVGGLDAEAAAEALRMALPSGPESTDTDIRLPTGNYTLPVTDTGVQWDVEESVSQAFLAPEGSAIEPVIRADRSRLEALIAEILGRPENTYLPSGYRFDGDEPDLSAAEALPQTLVIEPGRPGIQAEAAVLADAVLAAWQKGETQMDLSPLVQLMEPENIDLDAIWQQVYIAPATPSWDSETSTLIQGHRGYGFDPEEAWATLAETAPGGSAVIPCVITEPDKYTEDFWFADVLGRCRTPHTDNENRNDNLRLACGKLDGLILEPGQQLSYNELLGERTSAKGYKPAPAYSGTELVDEIGGGICQVSSTLYLSALLAEVKIVSRTNHGYPVDYIPIGLDATVNWGTTDFVIQNNYPFPIQITAQVTEEDVFIQILGMETRDYYVRIEHRVEGPRYASAYLCHYDPKTDKEISRKLDHASLYLDIVWQWPDFADNDRIVTYR